MKPICAECGCQTGGGEYCYAHKPYTVKPYTVKPYTVKPLKDGTFLVDRNGRKHVYLDEPPSLESENEVGP